MSLNLAVRRRRQEDGEFKTSLGYILIHIELRNRFDYYIYIYTHTSIYYNLKPTLIF